MSAIEGRAGLAPSKGSEGESASGLSSNFGRPPVSRWHFRARRSITPTSAFIVMVSAGLSPNFPI